MNLISEHDLAADWRPEGRLIVSGMNGATQVICRVAVPEAHLANTLTHLISAAPSMYLFLLALQQRWWMEPKHAIFPASQYRDTLAKLVAQAEGWERQRGQ